MKLIDIPRVPTVYTENENTKIVSGVGSLNGTIGVDKNNQASISWYLRLDFDNNNRSINNDWINFDSLRNLTDLKGKRLMFINQGRGDEDFSYYHYSHRELSEFTMDFLNGMGLLNKLENKVLVHVDYT